MFINPYHIDEDLFASAPAESTPSPPFVEMVRSRTLHEVLADTMRTDILNGDLPPGRRLDEETLAKRYGIARQPVREALKTLSREGLIEVDESGCRVAAPEADEIAFARQSLALLEKNAQACGIPFDSTALRLAASGDPSALPTEPSERLLIAALIPVWRRLTLAGPQSPTGNESVR